MQKRKKKRLVLGCLFLGLSIWLSVIITQTNQSTTDSPEKKAVKYEVVDGDTTHTGTVIEDEESLVRNFHTNLKDAVDDNNFSEDGSPIHFSLKKEIKRLEDDTTLILFGVFTEYDGTEIFSTMKFRKKTEKGVLKYSNPFFRGPLPYGFLEHTESKKNILRDQGGRRIDLLNSSLRNAKGIIDEQPNFTWTISLFDEIKDVKVNGKKPDSVIPFKLNGHELYFAYFDELGKIKEVQLGEETYNPK